MVSLGKIAANRQPVLWTICILLVAIVWVVFGQTLGHDFVNYDDKTYVYGNPIITRGVTRYGIIWAFTHTQALYWDPLATISHMLDFQLFGLNPCGHHFNNVLLHSIAVLLLFLLLLRMTEDAKAKDQPSRLHVRRSAFVAALFAIHPLRVESVAWIAERKDVLSAVFFMLILGAYVRYARNPTLARYMTVSILFICGLMSKPMLVTVPFVLLLLDYWPLGRTGGRGREFAAQRSMAHRLILEKIPLFALSAAVCLVTLFAQRGSAVATEPFPLMWRIESALVSYVIYIAQMFWPANLAVLYPVHPVQLWQTVFTIVFLVSMSGFAIVTRKTRPYIFTGWFWYCGMLVPVSGLAQSGWQSHADRYTYLPQIGLYLAATWAAADFLLTPSSKSVPDQAALPSTVNFRLSAIHPVFALSLVIIGILAWQSWNQTKVWRNTETLWTHTLAVTSNNDIAHHNIGLYYASRGQVDEAISHYQAALRAGPVAGKRRYRALVHNNLGSALEQKGQLDEAMTNYQQAIWLRPDYADAHFNFGTILLQKGDLDQAIVEWRKTLSINPGDTEAHLRLGDAFVQKRRLDQALSHYEAALQIEPRSVLALNKLAWILSTGADASVRNASRAIDVARKAGEYSDGRNPTVLRTLAAAYAESGRFGEAIETALQAARMAKAMDQDSLAQQLEKDVELYRQGSALRDYNLSNAGGRRP